MPTPHEFFDHTGNRNRDIAERLFVSEHTVKIHIKHMLEKLGAIDRTHAVAIASGADSFISRRVFTEAEA